MLITRTFLTVAAVISCLCEVCGAGSFGQLQVAGVSRFGQQQQVAGVSRFGQQQQVAGVSRFGQQQVGVNLGGQVMFNKLALF